MLKIKDKLGKLIALLKDTDSEPVLVKKAVKCCCEYCDCCCEKSWQPTKKQLEAADEHGVISQELEEKK